MSSASSSLPDRLRRARRHLSRRFTITLITVIGLLIIGVSSYRLLEGMSFIDALYMTITTITTVGACEVQLLSPVRRVFTIGLIIGGVSIAAYALGDYGANIHCRRSMNLRPSANILPEPGMRLIVLGARDQLQGLIAAAR